MENLTIADKPETKLTVENFENDSTYNPEGMDKIISELEDKKYVVFAQELEKIVYMSKNDKAVWGKLPLTPYDRVEILVDLLQEEKKG